MKRSAIRPATLRWRLVRWLFGALAVMSILLSLVQFYWIRRVMDREADARISALAGQLATSSVLGVLSANQELLDTTTDSALSQRDVVGVGIYDSDGNAIGGRTRNGRELPTLPEEPGACWPCRRPDASLRWAAPVRRRVGGDAFDFAGSSGEGLQPEPVGWIVLDVSTANRRAERRKLAANSLVVSAGVLLLGLIVTLALARRLTSPLMAMGAAAREVGRGRWDTPLPAAPYREIDALARELGAMARDLAALDEENQAYRTRLESMVEERTHELEARQHDLEDAYEKLKAAAESKDQFVATVSHDFRSPLGIILTSVQTILNNPGMDAETRGRFLNRAERHCRRLGTLVEDLLDLARIEQRDAQVEICCLRDVVRDSVEVARAAFDQNEVALSVEGDGSTLWIEADRGHLDRALGNLLDNARKFTPPGGHVRVEVSGDDGFATVAVVDSGPGIPEEEREQVFERFYQGKAGSGSGEGSGLGLAIVAGVARKHGGRVTVENRPGAGACFRFQLPIASEGGAGAS